jgi:hypothetical protein
MAIQFQNMTVDELLNLDSHKLNESEKRAYLAAVVATRTKLYDQIIALSIAVEEA